MESARTCPQCGRGFTPLKGHRGGRFCVPACATRWYRQHPVRPVEMRQCDCCVAVFPRQGRKRYCSRVCRDVGGGSLTIGPWGWVIVCAICDKRGAVGSPNMKACHACTREWRNRKSKDWNEANRERRHDYEAYRYATQRERFDEWGRRKQWRRRGARWASAAEEVERTWLALPPGPPVPEPPPPRRFPASDVNARPRPRQFIAGVCPQCGDAFVGQWRGKVDRFCSGTCGRRHHRRQRRHRHSPSSDPAVRLAVFERNGYLCQLCEGPTWPNLTVPHLLAPVIDHIQPRSQGGPDVIENFQTAHFYCNSLKCAMDDEDFKRRYVWPHHP